MTTIPDEQEFALNVLRRIREQPSMGTSGDRVTQLACTPALAGFGAVEATITDSVARPVRRKLELSISALPSALRISAGVPM